MSVIGPLTGWRPSLAAVPPLRMEAPAALPGLAAAPAGREAGREEPPVFERGREEHPRRSGRTETDGVQGPR